MFCFDTDLPFDAVGQKASRLRKFLYAYTFTHARIHKHHLTTLSHIHMHTHAMEWWRVSAWGQWRDMMASECLGAMAWWRVSVLGQWRDMMASECLGVMAWHDCEWVYIYYDVSTSCMSTCSVDVVSFFSISVCTSAWAKYGYREFKQDRKCVTCCKLMLYENALADTLPSRGPPMDATWRQRQYGLCTKPMNFPLES